MFCNGCGKEMVATAAHCVSCGTPNKAVASPMSEDTQKKLIIWGWILAVLLPIGGIIIGIILLIKGKIGHGIGQLITAVCFWAFWIGFMGAMATY